MKRTIRKWFDQLTGRTDLLQQIDRLRVQLAGCSVAANGGDLDLSRNEYGYSPAFGEIVRLWNYTHARIEELEAEAKKDNRELARLGKFEKDHFHDVEDLTNRLKQYARVDAALRERLKVNWGKVGLD